MFLLSANVTGKSDDCRFGIKWEKKEEGRRIFKSNLKEENINDQYNIFKPPNLIQFQVTPDIWPGT
jgi:hypothetical protein